MNNALLCPTKAVSQSLRCLYLHFHCSNYNALYKFNWNLEKSAQVKYLFEKLHFRYLFWKSKFRIYFWMSTFTFTNVQINYRVCWPIEQTANWRVNQSLQIKPTAGRPKRKQCRGANISGPFSAADSNQNTKLHDMKLFSLEIDAMIFLILFLILSYEVWMWVLFTLSYILL